MDFSTFEKFYVDNVNDKEIDINRHFLLIAGIISMRSPCIRRKYGAVIVKDNKIISTGCNTFPEGTEDKSLFPEGMKHKCAPEYCVRELINAQHGKDYQGTCDVIHAEVNAIMSANPSDVAGSNLYLIGFNYKTNEFISGIPCELCRPIIRNAKINRVITIQDNFKYIWYVY